MPLADDDLRRRLAVVPAPALDVDADLATVRALTDGRRRRRHVVMVAVGVLTLVIAGGIGLLAGTADHGARRSIVAEPTPTRPDSTATSRLPPDVASIPSSAVDVFPRPTNSGATLSLGAGSVWIGGWRSDTVPCHLGCGRVTRIDPDSGVVEATITVPKYPRAIVYGLGALWAEVELPDNSAALVVKIDPATNRVVAQAEIPDTVIMGSTGHPRLAVGVGAVWSLYGDQLTKFDPESGAVVANVRLAAGGDGFVADDEGVWVVGSEVTAIDPATLDARPIATLPLGFVQSSTLDGGTIWLTEAHGGPAGTTAPVIELVKVDTATGKVTYTGIPTTNVAAGGGRVWFQGFAGAKVADTHPDDVVEIDPATARMLRTATVGFDVLQPPILVVDEHSVWLLGPGGLIRLRYP